MINPLKIITIILLASFTQNAQSQTAAETAKMADNFSKVMAFTQQPYLHYRTVTKMTALPVLEQKDTATLMGEFFKNRDDFYSNNGMEEVFIQDSFLVRVNHERKSIWISKVDIASKKRFDILPVNSKQLEALFLKNYAITSTILNDSISRMDFIAKQKDDKASSATIRLEYNIKKSLPTIIELKATLRQPADEAILATLNKEHIDSTKLIKIIDGTSFLVRTQQKHIAFEDIDNAPETATKMPSWKTVLEFDTANNEFVATASYKEYEVTQTF